MSATNRGEERYSLDDYPTPEHCVHRLLDRVTLPGSFWLEPCAGEGSIVRAVTSHYSMAGRPIHWHVNEIQEKYREPLERLRPAVQNVFMRDLLKWDTQDIGAGKYDVCITNPPFALAREVCEIGMRLAHCVVLLLRLNFFGSKERHDWISTHMPRTVGVLPDRPSFRISKKTGKVGTDATEYAWFVWEERAILGWERRSTELIMLPRTDPTILAVDRDRIRAATPASCEPQEVS